MASTGSSPEGSDSAANELERLRRELAQRDRTIAALIDRRGPAHTSPYDVQEWGVRTTSRPARNSGSSESSVNSAGLSQPFLLNAHATTPAVITRNPSFRAGVSHGHGHDPSTALSRDSAPKSPSEQPLPYTVPVATVVAMPPGLRPAAGPVAMSDEELARYLQQQEQMLAEGEPSAYQHAGGYTYPPTGSMNDAQLAAAMQQEEMMTAAAMQRAEALRAANEVPCIEDPIWGRYMGRVGKPFKPHEVLCFSMCPCCMPPCCSDDRKRAYRWLATTACLWLSVLQILAYGLSLSSLIGRGVAPTDINPMWGPWPDTLDLMQAKNAARIAYWYELWRLATPIFLHAGFIHLATNLLMQLRMGLYVEQMWGAPRFLTVYLASGVFASVFSTVFKPDQISVGASGSLMGIMGAWIVHMLLHWSDGTEGHQGARAMQFIMTIVTISIILGMSFVPYIDWAAHLAGLVGGAFVGMVLFGGRCVNPTKRRLVQGAGLFFFLGISIVGLCAIFTVIQPPRELLHFCRDVVRPSFPSYDLKCYGN